MMREVTLTWFELYQASCVGAMRQIEALKNGRADQHGLTLNQWGVHIEGAAAELGAAKMLSLYWNALGPNPTAISSDLGTRTQVRSTTHTHGCLILHDTDPDDADFYLMVGAAPHFRMHGPKPAGELKQARYWRTDTGRPAYFVPQEAL